MVVLVRAARVALILLVASLVVSLIIGIGNAGTGLFEKLVLVALVAGCVVLAAKVTSVATALEKRLGHR